MPWELDGTFLRVTNNTEEEGTDRLWQQDLTATIKIIASRHDFHDHDLAQGIARTLNIDGYNQMYADLNVGGFKIVGVDVATAVGDVPLYGQCAGAMDWEFDTGSQLRLLDRNGDVIDTVIIPVGGGGGGGITSISGAGALVSSPDPITLTGTINMIDLHGSDTALSGGISAIQFDRYGRVTGATAGAFANTNLGNNPAPTIVEITSSTGSNRFSSSRSRRRYDPTNRIDRS